MQKFDSVSKSHPERVKETIRYMAPFMCETKVRDVVFGRTREPTPSHTNYGIERAAAEAAIGMCFGKTFAERVRFLNQLATHVKSQFPDEESHENNFLQLGDCLLAIKEIMATMEIMSERTDVKSVDQKKVLLTAMIRIANDSVSNLPFLRSVLGRNFVLRYASDLAVQKQEFVQKLTTVLGDINSRKGSACILPLLKTQCTTGISAVRRTPTPD